MLYKKATILSKTLISLGLIVSSLATTNYALASTNNDKSINSLSFDNNYAYFNVGVNAYMPNFPTLYTGLTDASGTQNILKYTFNGVYPQYNATLGYHFVNDSFLTGIFGTDNNIETAAQIINFHSGNNLNPADYQNINFNINQGGTRFGGAVLNMTSGRLSTSMVQENYMINWVGNKAITSNISMQPSIGPVFMQNRQNFHLLANFTGDVTDGEERYDNLQATYYGLNLGDTFSYQNASHLTPSAGLTVALLHPVASYGSWNNVSTQQQPQILLINKSRNQFLSYKVSPTVNLNYRFLDRKDSPSISLLAGLDYWTWVPKVTAAGVQTSVDPARLKHTSMLASTIGLEFHMPIA